jgi:glycine/betaine/sarcosine/D-proline reductase family selenoprotein B
VEIEKLNIPIVQITAISRSAFVVGSNRILHGTSVVNPIGDATLSPEREKKLRRSYIERALHILNTDVEEPTVFESSQ